MDILTGEVEIIRSDLVYDMGKSINPATDVGQIEGAFMQGVGRVLLEDVVTQMTGPNQGQNNTPNTWGYKIPASTTVPRELNVDLYPRANSSEVPENPNLLMSAKEVGEPPLCMATTVYFALKHAILDSRVERGKPGWFRLDMPCTVQRVREACAGRSRRVVPRAARHRPQHGGQRDCPHPTDTGTADIMVNRLRRGVNALLAVVAVTAIGVSLIGCASAPPLDASVDSSGDSSCRRNYLTADDLAPSRMFQDPLPIPNRLTPTYTAPEQSTTAAGTPVWVVHARSYTWRPADGVCIDKWGFEGTTPGPTLVAEPHEASELLVYNELPDNLYNPYVDPFNQLAWQQAIAPDRTHYTAFGPSPIEPPAPYDEAPYAQTQYELNPELSIHLHGGHQTPQNDGHPMDTFGPGQSHMYDYPNNQEATTLWYHDHAMDHTRGHVLNGLAGFYLVEDPATDAQVGLPTGTECTSVPSIAPTAEMSPPYWPTPDPVPVDPEQPTACDDIPIMFQQVPAEMLSGQEFQPNAIAAPNEPAEHSVSGGVDGQRHPRAVPDGNQQAVPLPVPQRQRRGTVADLDHHRRRRSDVVLVGRLSAAGRYGRRADELGGGRRPTVADPHPTVPGTTRRRRHRLLQDHDEDDDLPAEQHAAGIRRRDGTRRA